MRNLTVTFSTLVKGNEFEHEFEFTDCESEDDVKEAISEAYNETIEEDEDGNKDEAQPEDVEIISFDCKGEDGNEIDEKFDLYTFAEYYCNSDYQDADVLKSAFDCDVQPADVEEAYNGHYSSDEDFAQDMADQLGSIDKNASWPMNCIDWEYAAKELMYDYCESNGHYFSRNL
jgi:antirestriction protein